MIRRQILARNPIRRNPIPRNPATIATNPPRTTTSSQGSNGSSINGRVLENDGVKQGGVGAGAPAADEADGEALCPAAEKLACAVEAVLSREGLLFPSGGQPAPADDGGLSKPVVEGWSTTGESFRGRDSAGAVVVNNDEQNVRGRCRSGSSNNNGRGEKESESDSITAGLLQGDGHLSLPREDGPVLKVGVKGTDNEAAATAVKGGEDAGGAGMKYRHLLEQLGGAGTALRAALGNAERSCGAGGGAKGGPRCSKTNIDHSSTEDPLLVLSDFGDRGEDFEALGVPLGLPEVFPDCSLWKFRLNSSNSHPAYSEIGGYARPDSEQSKSEGKSGVSNRNISSRKRQRDEDGNGNGGGRSSGGGGRADGREKNGRKNGGEEHIGRHEDEASSCSSSLSSSPSSFSQHSNAWFRWKPGGYTLENDHEGESLYGVVRWAR